MGATGELVETSGGPDGTNSRGRSGGAGRHRPWRLSPRVVRGGRPPSRQRHRRSGGDGTSDDSRREARADRPSAPNLGARRPDRQVAFGRAHDRRSIRRPAVAIPATPGLPVTATGGAGSSRAVNSRHGFRPRPTSRCFSRWCCRPIARCSDRRPSRCSIPSLPRTSGVLCSTSFHLYSTTWTGTRPTCSSPSRASGRRSRRVSSARRTPRPTGHSLACRRSTGTSWSTHGRSTWATPPRNGAAWGRGFGRMSTTFFANSEPASAELRAIAPGALFQRRGLDFDRAYVRVLILTAATRWWSDSRRDSPTPPPGGRAGRPGKGDFHGAQQHVPQQ